MQELYYRKTKNVLSARIWYQSAYRNLPSSMLSLQVNSGEKQSDESLRTMLNYNAHGVKNEYFLTGAWMVTRLNYTNMMASINSRNLSHTLILKAGLQGRIGEYTKLKVVVDEELSVIKSNNYEKNATRSTATFTATAERNRSDRVGTMILIREIFNNNTFLIPDFSAGLQYRIIDSKEYFLKANISKNSKIPTMNDMFWVPGGNPELKNEHAFMYELSWNMNQKISSSLNMSSELSLFRNSIRDMIQWHPGEYSFWTADNIQNVNTTGVESSFALDYIHNNLVTRFKAEYSLTKSYVAGSDGSNGSIIGKQLMYIPENKANTSFRIGYRYFYASWVSNYVGRRYITSDNSGYLPDYFLNDLLTGIKINLKDSFLDINFNIDNLFNINYQSIAHYPLPGRSYSIKILVQIVK
jgi:outer membrane cobalamin receptor